MNKILIGISILFGSILVVVNMAINGQGHIIIGYGSSGTVAMEGILIGIFLGFGLKGFLLEKSGSSYDDDSNDGINF